MSKIPSFLIVADRGRLLTYIVEANRRRAMPRLVESLELSEGRAQMRELVTDRMGAFPNAGTAGQGNSPAERMTLAEEFDLRNVRQLARSISQLLEEHRPDRWGFAAPGEINGCILEELPTRWKSRLTHNLQLDLTRIPRTELLAHFEE